MKTKSKKITVKKFVDKQMNPKQMYGLKGGQKSAIIEEDAEGF